MKTKRLPLFRVMCAVMLVAVTALPFLTAKKASADQIVDRSLTLIGTDKDNGGAKPGALVNHQFDFTLPSVGNGDVGSIRFQYCTTAAPVQGGVDCDTPIGLNTNNASLTNQTGAAGFTIDTAVPGNVVIERVSATSVAANTPVSYTLSGIINPTTLNTSFFVRISTYLSTDGSGSAIDNGTVTAAITNPIIIDGTMPESLVFCAAQTVSLNLGGVPDCSTATDGSISFDQLFSPTDTATATRQMAASTNAGAGYVITVNGPTLTSGTNTISAMTTTGTLNFGVSQFGLNLVENVTTMDNQATPLPLGENIASASNGTNFNGRPTTGYNTADSFTFNPGAIVADSDFQNDGIPTATDSQIYTVSYVVNVPGSQPAGTYTTTLTYICTPTF